MYSYLHVKWFCLLPEPFPNIEHALQGSREIAYDVPFTIAVHLVFLLLDLTAMYLQLQFLLPNNCPNR
jgi:hypothetical protein